MSNKVKDFVTSEKLREILHTETEQLLTRQRNNDKGLSVGDISRLEKLAKIHAILMAEQRNLSESSVLKDLSEQQLEEVLETIEDL